MPELHSPSHHTETPPPISATLDVQKQDLSLEVRSYADNLEAQVRAIFTEYGCQTWEEFLVLAEDPTKVSTEKMRGASLLMETLARVTEHPEVYTPAIERTQWFKDWYKKLGFDIEIPLPNIPPDEIELRSKLETPQALFYRPPTTAVSYEQFMEAVGQERLWTLTNDAERARVVWEPIDTGYWFWAEIAPKTPRTNTSWNDLNVSTCLLSLEEYMILWYAHKDEANTMLDTDSVTWFRTRFGPGALSAGAVLNRVYVGRSGLENLGILSQSTGGRASELVKP